MAEHDAPAYDLQALMRIFEAAKREAKPGDGVAANPLLWPDVRGIKAVADHMIAALTPSSAREEELREALASKVAALRKLEDDVRFYSGNEASGYAEIARLKAEIADISIAALAKIDAALQDKPA